MTQPVKFGLNVDPNTGGLCHRRQRITAIADASGLDLVGVQDHPYNDGFTDTLRPLITWLAARTSHVHLFPNVANLPLRPPAMLAKQASSAHARSGSSAPKPTAGRCPRPTCHQTGCPNSTRSSPAPPATLAVTRPRLPACTTSWA